MTTAATESLFQRLRGEGWQGWSVASSWWPTKSNDDCCERCGEPATHLVERTDGLAWTLCTGHQWDATQDEAWRP